MNESSSLYPLFARVQDRNVLVVGGGAVAERKVRALLGAGAKVHVGAPALSTQLEAWVRESRVSWRAGTFELDWLNDVWLAIAATDDPSVNAAVKASAEERRIWTNVVDDLYLSSFHVPAVVDRAPVCIAVSSGGAAPMLARRIRERIEAMVDHHTGPLAALLARHRQRIAAAYPNLDDRRDFYDSVYDGPVRLLLSQGCSAQAESLLANQLLQPQPPKAIRRLSVLHMTDPDPGSMTLDGLRALNTADALIYEQDSNAALSVVDLARRDAERYLVKAESWRSADHFASLFRDVLDRHRQVVVLCESAHLVEACETACTSLGHTDVTFELVESGRRLRKSASRSVGDDL